MYIKSLELFNYRNYNLSNIKFDEKINILHGNNAQGKTNILEAIYLCATNRSHRGSKDNEIIKFDENESHIKLVVNKDNLDHVIDIHLKSNKSKGIAINQKKIKKSSDLLGLLNVIIFSPEDLNIIKGGPGERRRFVDIELCQLDSFYIYNLTNYSKIVNQRNKLLKDISYNNNLKDTLSIWDMQLISYGSKIIERRCNFINQLNEILYDLHYKLSGGLEKLKIVYVPNVEIDNYENELAINQQKDIRYKQTNVGPHRDDFIFMVNDINIRKYGSQGQQRTAILSLKLAEIELMTRIIKDSPILLLDDVLSELDSNRQNYLLNAIGNIQTIITCTGLDDFVKNQFEVNKTFDINNGTIN